MVEHDYEPTAEEAKFVKCHDHLREELNNAYWHWSICKFLHSARASHAHELNTAPAFFELTWYGHFLQAVMRLTRLLSKGKKDLSMWWLLDFVDENRPAFQSRAFQRRMRQHPAYRNGGTPRVPMRVTLRSVAKDRQLLARLPAKNLRVWRNKALAHVDIDHVLSGIEVAKQYPVKVAELDCIIEVIDEVLDRYSLAYNGTSHSKGLPLQIGMQYIIDAIGEKLHRDEQSKLESTQGSNGRIGSSEA